MLTKTKHFRVLHASPKNLLRQIRDCSTSGRSSWFDAEFSADYQLDSPVGQVVWTNVIERAGYVERVDKNFRPHVENVRSRTVVDFEVEMAEGHRLVQRRPAVIVSWHLENWCLFQNLIHICFLFFFYKNGDWFAFLTSIAVTDASIMRDTAESPIRIIRQSFPSRTPTTAFLLKTTLLARKDGADSFVVTADDTMLKTPTDKTTIQKICSIIYIYFLNE